jgi:hypothetical protein
MRWKSPRFGRACLSGWWPRSWASLPGSVRHFTLEITDTRLRAARDAAAIAREAALDGVYVLRTSLAVDRLPTAEAVRNYKRLAAASRDSSRVLFAQDAMRPIRVESPRRASR